MSMSFRYEADQTFQKLMDTLDTKYGVEDLHGNKISGCWKSDNGEVYCAVNIRDTPKGAILMDIVKVNDPNELKIGVFAGRKVGVAKISENGEVVKFPHLPKSMKKNIFS